MTVRSSRWPSRPRLMGIIVLGFVLALVLPPLVGRHRPPVRPAGAEALPPNILFLLTDDLDTYEIAEMPTLQAQLVAKGVSFSNHFVSVSLCCPSRTTGLRGQYAHNTGVLTNVAAFSGGFPTAYAKGIEASTVATWLQDAGYRTALFGKYLNAYPDTASETYVPPGWDEWYSAVKGEPYTQYNYTLNENGTLVSYGSRPEDYGNTVYTRKARDFMTRAAQAGQPFFAYLSVYAPHLPSTPAPQDVDKFPGAMAPRTPNFNEADVSDKPQWLQAKPLLTPLQETTIDERYRKRLQSLQAVDRSIGKLIATLRTNGQLENTYIVFTSDNGFHLGQHRIRNGKQTAYEEDIRVPLIVRGPGVPRGETRVHMVGNIDYAPTFAELGGAVIPPFVDGRSFARLLGADPPSPVFWRRRYLVEYWPEFKVQTTATGAGPKEPSDLDQTKIPEYQAVRTGRYTYIELITGETELYDLNNDPYELENIASKAPPALLDQLHAELAALRSCAGVTCRFADE